MSCGIRSRLLRDSKLSAGIGLRSRFLGFHNKIDFLDFLVICINILNPKLSCPLPQYFPNFLFAFKYLVGVLIYFRWLLLLSAVSSVLSCFMVFVLLSCCCGFFLLFLMFFFVCPVVVFFGFCFSFGAVRL